MENVTILQWLWHVATQSDGKKVFRYSKTWTCQAFYSVTIHYQIWNWFDRYGVTIPYGKGIFQTVFKVQLSELCKWRLRRKQVQKVEMRKWEGEKIFCGFKNGVEGILAKCASLQLKN